MEKLGAIIKAQRPAESTGALMRPEQRLAPAQRLQVGELLANMIAAYPHQDLEASMPMYQRAWENLALEFGMNPLQRALEVFLTRQKFFPHPAEVREELEEMKQKAHAEAMKLLPKIGCPKCHDGGWADGWILSEVNGVRQVRKCDCFIVREQARGPQPALPDGKSKGGAA